MSFDVTGDLSDRNIKLIEELPNGQNPDSTMNPAYTIGQQIARPIDSIWHGPEGTNPSEVIRLLDAVRLDQVL
ncbi:MAG: hypothetical protein R3C44_05820 [Chloroflexota bacterium]